MGPQIGYNFSVGRTTVYTNLRAYWELDSYRRIQGNAVYATVHIVVGLFARRPESP